MKNNKTMIVTVVILVLVLIAGFTAMKTTNSVMQVGTGHDKSRATNFSMPMEGVAVSESTDDMMSLEPNGKVVVDQESPVAVDRKMIKNGNVTLKVDKVDDAARNISEIAKANGGEVFSSNFYQSSSKIKNGSMMVKVPVSNFEITLEEIKKVASLVVRESTSGKDVTEQYTDLQSRLKNKQAEEQSIAKILEQSGKITDVLAVTKELSRVRGEIEVFQGRIRLLESQTDMATINVSLSEDPNVTIVDSWRPIQVAKDALNDLIKNIQQFISFMIVLIIRTIPILLLYLVVFGLLYLVGKKVYSRFKKKE